MSDHASRGRPQCLWHSGQRHSRKVLVFSQAWRVGADRGETVLMTLLSIKKEKGKGKARVPWVFLSVFAPVCQCQGAKWLVEEAWEHGPGSHRTDLGHSCGGSWVANKTQQLGWESGVGGWGGGDTVKQKFISPSDKWMSPTLRATLVPGCFQFGRMVLVPGFMPNYAFYLSKTAKDWHQVRWLALAKQQSLYRDLKTNVCSAWLFWSFQHKDTAILLLFIVRTEAPGCRTANPYVSGPWRLSGLCINLGKKNIFKAIREFLIINIVKHVRNRSCGGSTLGKVVGIKLSPLMSSNKIKVLN